jgi:hypothetical protein
MAGWNAGGQVTRRSEPAGAQSPVRHSPRKGTVVLDRGTRGPSTEWSTAVPFSAGARSTRSQNLPRRRSGGQTTPPSASPTSGPAGECQRPAEGHATIGCPGRSRALQPAGAGSTPVLRQPPGVVAVETRRATRHANGGGACRGVPKPCFGQRAVIVFEGFGRCGKPILGNEAACCLCRFFRCFGGFLVPSRSFRPGRSSICSSGLVRPAGCLPGGLSTKEGGA